MTKPTILAIEDDDIAFRLIKRTLKELPVRVVNAPTGAEAITFIENEMPDLILLDLHLPDMRGWDVLDRFKGDERLKRSRVIVLTAQNNPVQRVISGLQAVAVFMPKPAAPEDLRARVRELLSLE